MHIKHIKPQGSPLETPFDVVTWQEEAFVNYTIQLCSLEPEQNQKSMSQLPEAVLPEPINNLPASSFLFWDWQLVGGLQAVSGIR